MKRTDSRRLILNARQRVSEARESHKLLVSYRLDSLVYWSSLVFLALFNLVGCFFLIPFLMLFDGFYLYVVVACFGLVFGFLFNLLIQGIEHFRHSHHIIAGIFIPLMAVIDILIILRIVERINEVLVKPVEYSVGQIIIVFVFAFVFPYLFSIVVYGNEFLRPHKSAGAR